MLVCGRIKPHTRFVGDVESGLMKMMLIGLGKHAGALVYHQAIQDYSFGQILRSVAREVVNRCHILAGLAIVENAYDETAKIVAVAPQDFESQERELLRLARQGMPKLPFDRADVLLIDEIGKDISGAGLDTNVVGRKYLDHAAREDEIPEDPLFGGPWAQPGHRRQCDRAGIGRVLSQSDTSRNGCACHPNELFDRQSCHGRHGSARLRNGPGDPGCRLVGHRIDPTRCRSDHVDRKHAENRRGGVFGGVL